MQCSTISNDHTGCCNHATAYGSTHQSLDELEFERGIWKAALDGDMKRATMLIQRDSECVNRTDTSGYTALVSK